jgi:hypothetical protein
VAKLASGKLREAGGEKERGQGNGENGWYTQYRYLSSKFIISMGSVNICVTVRPLGAKKWLATLLPVCKIFQKIFGHTNHSNI